MLMMIYFRFLLGLTEIQSVREQSYAINSLIKTKTRNTLITITELNFDKLLLLI